MLKVPCEVKTLFNFGIDSTFAENETMAGSVFE